MDSAPPRCTRRPVAAAVAGVVLVLLLVGCSRADPSDTGSPPPGAGHVPAEPGTEGDAGTETAGQEPLRARYELTRRTFSTLRDTGELAPGAFDAVLYTPEDARYMGLDLGGCREGQPCAFELMSCASGGEYVPAGSDGEGVDWLELQLASMAFEVLRLEALLDGQRYPETVWRAQLERYAQDGLQLLDDDPPASDNFSTYHDLQVRLHGDLLEELNRYREQHDPSLLPPVLEAGCGAGDIGINITTDPPGGVAEFIPVFHYRLCEVRGIDPDDTRACDHWRQPLEGLLFDVAGDYRYQVRWGDGQATRGKLSFTNLEEGQTVTLRRR